MANRIVLPWSTTLDCLTWSADDWLAVACGDRVAVITPRLHEDIGAKEKHFWEKTLFRANAFNIKEIPRQTPLAYRDCSLSEELSPRHVHHLAWSAPRLARYARCALAVLTSDLTLSLWDCVGRPALPSNWTRRVIVNHAVADYYERSDLPYRTDVSGESRLQVAKRIRAFCWSPPFYPNPAAQHDGHTALAHDLSIRQWLAVCTEAEDVLILDVRPPQILSTDSLDWQLEVIHRIPLGSTTLDGFFVQSSPRFKRYADAYIPRMADFVAWGSWKKRKQCKAPTTEMAKLAVLCHGRLLSISLHVEALLLDSEMTPSAATTHQWQYPCQKLDLRGPLFFVAGTDFVVCSAVDEILCVDTSVDKAGVENGLESNVSSHHLDGRWDSISGLAVTTDQKGKQTLHFTSALTTSTSPTNSLILPTLNGPPDVPPRWWRLVVENREQYSAENQLGEHVLEHTFGIAASQNDVFIATAQSMLPTLSTHYIILSKQESVIEISDVADAIEINLVTSLPAIPAEALFFNLKRLPRSRARGMDPHQWAESLLGAQSPWPWDLSKEGTSTSYDSQDVVSLCQSLHVAIYLHPAPARARLEFLAGITIAEENRPKQLEEDIIKNLVVQTCNLSGYDRQDGPISSKILQAHHLVKHRLLVEVDTTEEPTWQELCAVCQAPIPFESVKWAVCNNGHEYSRCRLTFLAIQQPEISKYCMICNAQYLDEWKLAVLNPKAERARFGQMQDTRDSTEPDNSLARVIFTALDLCIYCGGKPVPR